MEILTAVAIPLIALWLITRRADHDLRKAAAVFSTLTALWFAPCWLTSSTPVPLDFITSEVPWKALRPAGYLNKNFLLNDVPLQMLPWRESARRAILSGHLPLLNRFSAGGSPLWANAQAAVLYPITIAGLPFSTFAWPLFYATCKVLIALVGMYLFLRQRELSWQASIYGAIAYAFSTFTIAYLLFPHSSVTVLLPLVLYCLATGRIVPSTCAVAAMLVAGHPESVLHAAFVIIPWTIFRLIGRRASRPQVAGRPGPREEVDLTDLPAAPEHSDSPSLRSARPLLRYAFIAVLAAALAAPALLPFLAYLPHSQRVADLRANPAMSSVVPFELASFIPFAIPNYYGNPRVHNYRHPINFNELCTDYAGLTVLALAIGIVIVQPRRFTLEIVLMLIAILFAITPSPLERAIRAVPILNVTAHARIRFVIVFLLSLLAAHGFDALRNHARTFATVAAALFLIVTVTCVMSYPVFAHYGIRRLIFFTELAALAGTAFIVWMPLNRAATAPDLHGSSFSFHDAALPLLLFIDLASITALYNPAIGKHLYYPQTAAIEAMQRASTVNRQPSTVNQPYRIAAIDLALQPNTAAMFGLEDIRPHDPLAFQPYVAFLDRNGLDRSTYFERFRSLPPRPLLDFLGVRYVVAAPDAELAGLRRIYSGPDASVHENPTALPRFFVQPGAPPARVAITSYTPDAATIDVTADRDTTIDSSELALPGWELRNNGQRWNLRSTRGAFLTWTAPAGRTRFDLRYVPSYFRLAWIVSAVAVCALCLIAFR